MAGKKLIVYYNHLLSSVCSKNIVHFIESWFLTHCQILKVVLYDPLRLSPPPTYSELATAFVKLQFAVNRLLTGWYLVVSINWLAN